MEKIKAILYSRASTDETKQDVDMQLKELRKYAKAYGWEFDEVSEYGSGYKGCQPKLDQVLEKVRCKEYGIFLVYDLSRFSREHPKKTNALLDRIVYEYKCRFISLKDSIDSDNEMIWHVVRPLFTYFANIYSRSLSEKIRNGIQNKRDKGIYNGGRPQKNISKEEIRVLKDKKMSLREIAKQYNKNRPRKECISFMLVKKTLQDLQREK